MTGDGVPQGGGGRPGWTGLLLAGVVVLMVASLALFGGFGDQEPGLSTRPLPTTTSEAAGAAVTSGPPVEAAVGGEPVLVSTVLGNMEWRRVTGLEFDSVRRSLPESGWPVGETGVEWGLVGWPPSGWMVSDRGILDDAGLGAWRTEGWEPLEDGWVRLEVEDSGILIRVDWTVAGPGGVVLIGEPYGSGFPIGWVLSDDGIFELVGPLPFHPDHLEGSRGRPMVLPVADGFVGIGRREVGLVEFSTPGPGQELWWSGDGRSWVLVEDAPFGEGDGWVETLRGYGGRWIGIGYSETTMPWERPVWMSEDGRVWERVAESPPLNVGWCNQWLAGGELGWVIVEGCSEQDGPVWLSRDGIEWQAAPVEGMIGEDGWWVGEITVGADRIVIGLDRWGEPPLGWVGTLVGESVAETLTALPIVEVRLEGGAFFERASTEPDIRRGLGLVSAAETVADGRFLVEGQQWDEGPVWWESGAVNEEWGDQQPRWIELDLGGMVTVGSAIVQADGNDEYLLSYRDPTTEEWEPLWHVPQGAWFGVITRSNPADDTERKVFPEPVTTNRLRFEAWSGDGMYSVSEIQVFTTVTPVQWGITPNDQGSGIHTVAMIVDVRPLTDDRVEDVSGRLIWDETVVDLCGISVREVGDGFLLVGDIFQTSEGCGNNPNALQDAFDEFGLPKTACVTVRFGGVDHEYCAPLR